MRGRGLGKNGVTMIELLVVSFVLSLVMVMVFRALTLFTKGAVQIQQKLPGQNVIQTAYHFLMLDLASASRGSVNNLLPNPCFFEDDAGALVESNVPSSSTWSCPAYRMAADPAPHSSVAFFQSRLELHSVNSGTTTAYALAAEPAVKVETFLFSASYFSNNIGTRKAEVRGGPNPFSPVSLVYQDTGAQNGVFTTTVGDYYQVHLFDEPPNASDSSISFGKVYLGPISVEISTANPSGRLFFRRCNPDGNWERVTYTMNLLWDGRGRLIRTRFLESGKQETVNIDGIDSLQVSWSGAPSATGGTNRSLVVQLVGRGPSSRPADAVSIKFEVYPNAP